MQASQPASEGRASRSDRRDERIGTLIRFDHEAELVYESRSIKDRMIRVPTSGSPRQVCRWLRSSWRQSETEKLMCGGAKLASQQLAMIGRAGAARDAVRRT